MRSTLFIRSFLSVLVLLLCLSGFTQQFYLFIGTYTNTDGNSKGIYVYKFDAATGKTTPVSTAFAVNPSYLAPSPDGKFLYAVNETDGATPGGVSAFAFDRTSGQLRFLDRQASGGDDPCYVSVDAHRKWLMVANYNGGNLSVLPIRTDGSLASLTQTIQHSGKGYNPQRQEKPHVHSVTFTPDENYLITADLGLDRLSAYSFDTKAITEPLKLAPATKAAIPPGSGPRHIAFYPGKPYVYLINELSGTVEAFQYNDGLLTLFQTISSHPDGYKGSIGSADIHITPNGKFLYASNRGDANSIAIYSIDSTSGKLELKGIQSTLGQGPRNFVIDPTGQWLLAANQKTNNIILFRIDRQTGLLTPEEGQMSIPAPVCLKMITP